MTDLTSAQSPMYAPYSIPSEIVAMPVGEKKPKKYRNSMLTKKRSSKMKVCDDSDDDSLFVVNQDTSSPSPISLKTISNDENEPEDSLLLEPFPDAPRHHFDETRQNLMPSPILIQEDADIKMLLDVNNILQLHLQRSEDEKEQMRNQIDNLKTQLDQAKQLIAHLYNYQHPGTNSSAIVEKSQRVEDCASTKQQNTASCA